MAKECIPDILPTCIKGPNGLGQEVTYRLNYDQLEAQHPDGHWWPARKATREEIERTHAGYRNRYMVTAKELREALADFEDDALVYVSLPTGGHAPVNSHSLGIYLQRHGTKVPTYAELLLGEVIPWNP